MNAQITQLDALPAVACPCGLSRRAFAVPDGPASVHLVEINAGARAHYHRRMTEIYVVLEGEGEIELDGQLHSIKPLTCVLIPPGCRHRAVGRMRLLNVPIPAFDPKDEFFD